MPIMSQQVTVVGAGVFGAWTAWHLRRAGARVALIDAFGPAHSRASSGGESRIIRMSYGADEIYTRLAMRSLGLWKDFGRGLFQPTGVLSFARAGDPYSDATRATLSRAAVAFEVLDRRQLAARWPQIRLDDPRAYCIFEPGSGALLARRAVAEVVADAVRMGATYETTTTPPPADTIVYACGPWLPKLFPDVLGDRIFPTRQEVFFFAAPPGDPSFSAAAFPAWIDFTDPRGPYGIPDLESRGFKLAFDRHGPAFDPDAGDRRVTDAGLAEARRFLAERFPALRDAPLTESRVCQYENTSTGDFLVDRHPDHENIWLVGGGSGHGFKHGPALGEYVAQRILHGGDVEPRWQLRNQQQSQQRSVF